MLDTSNESNEKSNENTKKNDILVRRQVEICCNLNATLRLLFIK